MYYTLKAHDLLTQEERNVFSRLWNISTNILYGKGKTRKERKEISEELYELHDLILKIAFKLALRSKK